MNYIVCFYVCRYRVMWGFGGGNLTSHLACWKQRVQFFHRWLDRVGLILPKMFSVVDPPFPGHWLWGKWAAFGVFFWSLPLGSLSRSLLQSRVWDIWEVMRKTRRLTAIYFSSHDGLRQPSFFHLSETSVLFFVVLYPGLFVCERKDLGAMGLSILTEPNVSWGTVFCCCHLFVF